MGQRDWLDRLQGKRMNSQQASQRSFRRGRRRVWHNLRDLPIFYKLLLSIVAVVLLALGVTTYINVTTLERQLSVEIGDNFGNLATAQMNYIADILSEQIAILRSIAANDYVRIGALTANARYSGDSEVIESQLLALNQQWLTADVEGQLVRSILDPDLNRLTFQLENYAEAFPDHAEIFITDRYGGVLAATNRTSDYYQADELWWQAAYNDGKGAFYIGQPGYDQSAGLMAMVIAAPIRAIPTDDPGNAGPDADGEVIGIARTTFNIDVIYRAVGSERFGETGGATLVDAQGRMIAGRNPIRIGRSVYPDWIEYARAHKNRDWHRDVDEDGVPVLLGYAYLSEAEVPYTLAVDVVRALDWLMFVHKSQAEAYAPVVTARRTGILASGIFGLLAAGLALLIARTVVLPISHLVEVSRSVAAGDLEARAKVSRGDEMGQLAEGFNSMADEIAEMVGSLEQRVALRTSELEQRSRYLEASASVSRAVTSILDVDDLIRQVVELIRGRFKLDYVGLFLVDETRTWAVLRAGTGKAGEAMLERGHRVKIGEGMVGWSVAHARPRIAMETAEDAMRVATLELPDTRSEAALPLRSRGQVLGAITVQSSRPDVFDEDTVTVLQSLADQVAVALDNARLLTESQASLDKLNRLYGETVREGWNEVFRARPNLGYSIQLDGRVHAVTSEWRPLMLQAFRQGQSVLRTADLYAPDSEEPAAPRDEPQRSRGNLSTEAVLAVPVAVHDQVLGVMEFCKRDQDGAAESQAWEPGEISLLESLGEQLGLALERARLYQDTRINVTRARLVANMSARIRETLDLDTILQTAVREIAETLNIAEVEIRMGSGSRGDVTLSEGQSDESKEDTESQVETTLTPDTLSRPLDISVEDVED
jgi:GAF domain-containing protein/HAMP domain-containing protein